MRNLLSLTVTAALILSCGTVFAKDKPVQVYLLAGQSNMDGFGGLEALGHQIDGGDDDRKKALGHLRKDGEWIVRDDVWITFQDRKGPLSAGYGVGKTFFGAEWEFGLRLGDYHDEKVLIIKTSWGGASIRRKFRPPSSGIPNDLIDEEHKRRLEQHAKRKEKNPKDETPAPERESVEKIYGENYRRMMEVVRTTLADIKSVIPSYDGEGYEVRGFVWFQGFNDQFGDAHKEYATHLANLIRDVRKEFKKPDLPVVIGQMGHGGTVAAREKRKLQPIGDGTKGVKAGQAAVAAMDEFKKTVALVETDVFWDWKAQAVFDKGWREHFDEWRKIGAHFPYHYLGSPWTFMKCGDAFGKAMIALHSGS